MFNIIFVRIK